MKTSGGTIEKYPKYHCLHCIHWHMLDPQPHLVNTYHSMNILGESRKLVESKVCTRCGTHTVRVMV